MRGTDEWRVLVAQNVSMSLCFSPWDAAIFDVDLTSDKSRTEPTTQFDRTFEKIEASDVVDRFRADGYNTSRSILALEKPHCFLEGLPPLN